MKINLEFDTIEEWTQFINSFKKQETPRAPDEAESILTGPSALNKLEEIPLPIQATSHTKILRKTRKKHHELDTGNTKVQKQIKRAMLYANKHNIEFSAAIKKLYDRYASNWDYEIAARLGYKDNRKKRSPHYEDTITKSFFITKRTRLLTDMGWEHDEAEKAAAEAWDLGERDPDNFSKTKPRRQE